MKPVTVFFDIGGTLLGHPSLCETIAGKLGQIKYSSNVRELVMDSITNYRLEITSNNFSNIVEVTRDVLISLSEQYSCPDISTEARDLCLNIYGHQSVLYPETLPILEKLAGNGVEMIIASDNDNDILEIQLEKNRLAPYFTAWYISERVRCYKSSNEYVNHLRKHCVGREDSCFFIGDMEWDIHCGQKLGIHSVFVDRENRGNVFNADYIIDDLTGLLPLLGIE